MPNKLTIERQRTLEQQLEAAKLTMAGKEPPLLADVAATITALAHIVSELLAAFGPSDHAKAVDGERTRQR